MLVDREDLTEDKVTCVYDFWRQARGTGGLLSLDT
jgi:hypothetical protein